MDLATPDDNEDSGTLAKQENRRSKKFEENCSSLVRPKRRPVSQPDAKFRTIAREQDNVSGIQ